MSLGRVAMVVHEGKEGADRVALEITAFLEEQGTTVSDERPDLVISLGGDGTMLRAAQLAHARDAPLLGINLGTLGYLPEASAGEHIAALERVLAGAYELEERTMLACRADGRDAVALNEVLVERSSRHRLVRLDVKIGGESFASFNADGLIVATPTGSTAYALSAGGPIVSPRAQALVLVPVSAHMMFARPLVLAPDDVVEIRVDPTGEEASLSIDGAFGWDLEPGALVRIERHFRALRLVRLSGPGFIERLRSKMGLPP